MTGPGSLHEEVEMEDLVSVQEQFGSRGFALAAVNIDNSPAAAIDFVKRFELRTKKRPGFIMLYDKDKTVPRDYRQRSMPTSYLIEWTRSPQPPRRPSSRCQLRPPQERRMNQKAAT